MSNKARFVHKIVSGRAPMYESINKIIDYSKFEEFIKKAKCANTKDRFIRVQPGLSCSGPVLWNSLAAN